MCRLPRRIVVYHSHAYTTTTASRRVNDRREQESTRKPSVAAALGRSHTQKCASKSAHDGLGRGRVDEGRGARLKRRERFAGRPGGTWGERRRSVSFARALHAFSRRRRRRRRRVFRATAFFGCGRRLDLCRFRAKFISTAGLVKRSRNERVAVH